MKFSGLIWFVLLLIANTSFAQRPDIARKEVIYKRESSGFMDFRTNGWGAGYRYSKFKTGYKMKSWDFSFSVVKDLKQIKSSYYTYSNNRIYYGKMIHFYNFKVLRGNQKVLSTKPYWGGVEFRRMLYGGVNIGVGVPVWVYIRKIDDGGTDLLVPFDPDLYDRQDIQGKGPFVSGLPDAKLFPAASMKYAINVEYGTLTQITKGIELGLQLDVYPWPVQIMAYSNPSYFIISGFLSFHFGKRFNP